MTRPASIFGAADFGEVRVRDADGHRRRRRQAVRIRQPRDRGVTARRQRARRDGERVATGAIASRGSPTCPAAAPGRRSAPRSSRRRSRGCGPRRARERLPDRAGEGARAVRGEPRRSRGRAGPRSDGARRSPLRGAAGPASSRARTAAGPGGLAPIDSPGSTLRASTMPSIGARTTRRATRVRASDAAARRFATCASPCRTRAARPRLARAAARRRQAPRARAPSNPLRLELREHLALGAHGHQLGSCELGLRDALPPRAVRRRGAAPTRPPFDLGADRRRDGHDQPRMARADIDRRATRPAGQVHAARPPPARS